MSVGFQLFDANGTLKFESGFVSLKFSRKFQIQSLKDWEQWAGKNYDSLYMGMDTIPMAGLENLADDEIFAYATSSYTSPIMIYVFKTGVAPTGGNFGFQSFDQNGKQEISISTDFVNIVDVISYNKNSNSFTKTYPQGQYAVIDGSPPVDNENIYINGNQLRVGRFESGFSIKDSWSASLQQYEQLTNSTKFIFIVNVSRF